MENRTNGRVENGNAEVLVFTHLLTMCVGRERDTDDLSGREVNPECLARQLSYEWGLHSVMKHIHAFLCNWRWVD